MRYRWVMVGCLVGLWFWLNDSADETRPAVSPKAMAPPPPESVTLEREVPLQTAPEQLLGRAGDGFCGGSNPDDVRTPVKERYLSAPPLSRQQRILLGGVRDQAFTETDILNALGDSAWPRVLMALVAERRGAFTRARAHLDAAVELADGDLNKAKLRFFRGQAAEKELAMDVALADYRAYLKAAPRDIVVQQRVARLEVHKEIVSAYESTSDDGIRVIYPPHALDLSEAYALAGAAREAIDTAAELTGTEPRPELGIVVYPSRSELLATTCVPMWTGGVYDGVVRMVEHENRSRFETILRHEIFHAQIDHAVLRRIPAWFNEGLAQYFAGETPNRDVMLERMVEHETWIPFSSLQAQFRELEGHSDARLAYRQSALMIDWVVDSEGEDAIALGVRHLMEGGDKRELLAVMLGVDTPSGQDFLQYLKRR